VLCQQNQDINKDQLLGRKAFLYNKDITQLKAGKENIYKIRGGFFFFCGFYNAKRVIQNFQPYK